MEIIPNIGLGSLCFGMSPDEVVEILREQQTYEDWMGGNLNDSLLYHHLIIGFDKYDGSGPLPEGRLSDIRIRRRKDVTLWGKSISDWTKLEAMAHLDRSAIRYEAHDSGDLSVPSYSLSLSFDESGHVEFVEIWKSHGHYLHGVWEMLRIPNRLTRHKHN